MCAVFLIRDRGNSVTLAASYQIVNILDRNDGLAIVLSLEPMMKKVWNRYLLNECREMQIH